MTNHQSSALDPGFMVEGAFVYPVEGDPSAFVVVPGAPQPERDQAGRPALNLWASGAGSLLQLGTAWPIPESEIREAFARRHRAQADLPEEVILRPVGVALAGVSLEIGDGTGSFEPLQTVVSSGYPPYNAIFNATLDSQRTRAAIEALSGSEGFLRVRYDGTLPADLPLTATVEGEVPPPISKLLPESESGEETARQRIQAAVLNGSLRLTRIAPAGIERQAYEDLAAQAIESAALRLSSLGADEERTAGRSRSTTISVSVAWKPGRTLGIASAIDIATWFPEHEGLDHVHGIATSDPTAAIADATPSNAVSIRLDFDPGDAPINFIEIRRADERRFLRPPDYSPVTLPGGSDPVVARTHFADGGPAYDAVVSSAVSNLALEPGDVGLAAVSVDATARQSAGVRELSLKVAYRPVGGASGDERIVRLGGATWHATWHVVTRSPQWTGLLEYSWEGIADDGSAVRFAEMKTDRPTVRL